MTNHGESQMRTQNSSNINISLNPLKKFILIFRLCKTYPQYLIVPKNVTDEELEKVHSGRFFSRFPVASWRCKSSGGVLLRSAQPTISWLGVANENDIKYVETISNLSNPTVPSCDGLFEISMGFFSVYM